MRSGSPELVAALEAGQRTYDVQVRLGGQDVTPEVTSWSVDRGSDTSLPTQVATPTGSSAAEAQVTLAGVGEQTAAARYSPWAPRATADIARPGQSCVLEWGLAEERMQALRGRIRRVNANARTGTADVTALDGSELMRGRAWLPPGVEWGGGYLYTQWVVDHALRMSGIYASPPAREGSVFFASLNGGRQASLGMLISTTQLGRYYPARSPWTAGPAVNEDGPNAYLPWSATYAPQKRVLSQANQLMVEWWVYRRDLTDNPTSQVRLVFADRPTQEAGRQETTVTVSYDPSTRQLRAQVDNGSLSWTAPASTDQAGRFKVCFLVGLTTTSSPVTVRGWLYQPNGALYSTPTIYSGSSPTWGVLDTVTVTGTGPMECVGVAPVSGTIEVVQPWRRGAVIDIIGPGGTGAMHYRLDALPDVSGTWWDLVKQIATDQAGFVWFTEDGILRFRRYDYLRPDSALLPDPDLTVTAARDIADLSVTEEIDSVRNRIEVGYSPHERGNSAQDQLYDFTTATVVGSGVVTAPLRFDLQGRPWSLRCPMTFAGSTKPVGHPGSLVKFVTASGSRAPVEVELTWTSGYPELTYHNRGANTAYAALSGSDLGAPSLRLAHAEIDTPRAQPIGRQNLESIARYGTQLLEIGASPWVQNSIWADQIGLALVAWTAWPVPLTGAVEILPDPRIQLGDVIRIVDRTGTRIDGLYRVLGYSVRGSGTSVRMTLDVRPLSRPALPEDAGLTTEPALDPAAAELLPG
ncbi:hypothetical protein [Nocardiopsis synnemataformans]|uniref:hypothetical protein n=1 Tax=Nocardiopsis synnemataformans TaxID=61305 RepID=UPI003EBF2AE6